MIVPGSRVAHVNLTWLIISNGSPKLPYPALASTASLELKYINSADDINPLLLKGIDSKAYLKGG